MSNDDYSSLIVKLFSSQGVCLHTTPQVEQDNDNLFDLVHVFRQFSREVDGGELHRLVFQPPVNFQNTFTTSFSGRLYDWKQQEKQAIQVIFDDKASPIYILVKASLSLPVDSLHGLIDDIQQCFQKFDKLLEINDNNHHHKDNWKNSLCLPEQVKQVVTELTTKVAVGSSRRG